MAHVLVLYTPIIQVCVGGGAGGGGGGEYVSDIYRF